MTSRVGHKLKLLVSITIWGGGGSTIRKYMSIAIHNLNNKNDLTQQRSWMIVFSAKLSFRHTPANRSHWALDATLSNTATTGQQALPNVM